MFCAQVGGWVLAAVCAFAAPFAVATALSWLVQLPDTVVPSGRDMDGRCSSGYVRPANVLCVT